MPSNPQRNTHFAATYEPETARIADARDAFSDWLRRTRQDGELHDEMLVVLSELVANAVTASRSGSDLITVEAWIDDDGLTLEVTNPASAVFTTASCWDFDDPLRTGGRGLILVEALVDDLSIAPPDDRHPLSVRCRRELAALQKR